MYDNLLRNISDNLNFRIKFPKFKAPSAALNTIVDRTPEGAFGFDKTLGKVNNKSATGRLADEIEAADRPLDRKERYGL